MIFSGANLIILKAVCAVSDDQCSFEGHFVDAADSCLQLEASCLQLSLLAYGCASELLCLQFELWILWGAQKLVRFKWGFGEGLLNDQFACTEAYKSPIPKRRKLLAERPF